ncbi:type III pantothenate kinase [Olleya aquimaris]|uniref:Type III pantothenate kinase n=1 Tax=Olleya aquimaris TaxID=639310 RepID=A0A327RDQ7_9FLAO|nr:type III pantothenate kinase [Olleya aquimaris]RAJ15110.1 type III pantothenate kinase [Olleya aquimaris]
MNLIIDVGNTRTKLAVFKENSIVEREVVNTSSILKSLKTLKKSYTKINNAIVSSVGHVDDKSIQYLKKKFNFLELSHETPVPFTNLYATPTTLGLDRIALVCASVQQFSDKNVLIIDAGTCVTYDFINSKNEYLGGAISPGIRMRYQALHNQTAKLPLLETKIPEHFIGNSTMTSINSGVVNGILNEIDGVINQYKTEYPDLTIILTGGDANFLSKQLKSSIFANSNFLLEGLNFILQYNIV